MNKCYGIWSTTETRKGIQSYILYIYHHAVSLLRTYMCLFSFKLLYSLVCMQLWTYDCVKNCGMSSSYWQETKFAWIYNSCRKALKSNAQSARFTCPCVRIIWPLGIIRVQIKWTEEMRACQQFTPRIDMFSHERDRSRNLNTNMMYTSIVDIKLNLTAN